MSVLYDVPGPRARRITWIISVLVVLAVAAALYFFVYLPLDEYGQFTAKKWGPLVDPSHKQFALVWKRIGEALLAKRLAAGLAIIASVLAGVLLATLRVQFGHLKRRRFPSASRAAALSLRAATTGSNGVLRVFVEVFRGLPVVITIYFVARVLPEFGVDFPTLWYLVIGLSLYNGVVIAEILRSGMTGLPGGQREAAEALGFSSFATIRLILLPQSLRVMLPALIGQVVVIVKDTSLGFIISYEELLAVAVQIINVLNNPIQLYAVIAVIFLVVNYALSKLAVWVERRLARGQRPPGNPPTGVYTLGTAGVGGLGGPVATGSAPTGGGG